MDYGLLAGLVVLWGSAYAMTHVGLEAFPPGVLVAARLWIGAIVLGAGLVVFRARLPRLAERREWALLALIGLSGTLVPFLLISHAQKAVPSALAAVWIAAAPLVVAILSHLFVPGEKLVARRAIGLAVGFGGVGLLFAPAILDGGGAPLADQGLLLLAAVFYASTSVMVRLAAPGLHPVAMSFGFVACAALASLPLAWVDWPAGGVLIETRHILAALGLGVLSTGVANLLYVMAIRRVGPVFMSNVGNLAPFWSILVGVVLLKEALPVTLAPALATILTGIWLVQRR